MKIAILQDGQEAKEFEAAAGEIQEIFSIAETLPDTWLKKSEDAEKLAKSIMEQLEKMQHKKG